MDNFVAREKYFPLKWGKKGEIRGKWERERKKKLSDKKGEQIEEKRNKKKDARSKRKKKSRKKEDKTEKEREKKKPKTEKTNIRGKKKKDKKEKKERIVKKSSRQRKREYTGKKEKKKKKKPSGAVKVWWIWKKFWNKFSLLYSVLGLKSINLCLD